MNAPAPALASSLSAAEIAAFQAQIAPLSLDQLTQLSVKLQEDALALLSAEVENLDPKISPEAAADIALAKARPMMDRAGLVGVRIGFRLRQKKRNLTLVFVFAMALALAPLVVFYLLRSR